MMKKYIIFIFLLLNSLSSFSVGNSLVGPTTVDPEHTTHIELIWMGGISIR